MRILIIALFLSACGSVNLSTLARLSHLDPLTANPAHFVIAVVLPEGLEIPQGSAVLTFKWQSATETVGSVYTLQNQAEFAGSEVLVESGNQVFFFNLSDNAVVDIRRTQEIVTLRKAAGIEGTGSLAIHAAPCLSQGNLVAAPKMSTYLRIESGGSFLPILQNVSLNDLAEEGALSDTPACE